MNEKLINAASSMVNTQWKIITHVQVPLFSALAASATKLAGSIGKLTAALAELTEAIGTEVEEEEEDPAHTVYSWPYGGYTLNVTGAECCGYLTCRCPEVDGELETMLK